MKKLLAIITHALFAATASAQCTDAGAYIFAKAYLAQEIHDPRAAFEPQAAALVGWSNDTATVRVLAYLPGNNDTPIVRSILTRLTCTGGTLDYYAVLIDGRMKHLRP